MNKIREVMEAYGLSLSDVARINECSKATISQLISNNYSGKKTKAQEVLSKLEAEGYVLREKKIVIKPDVFIPTRNVRKFDELCDEMFDEQADLTSSIGVVIGSAGRGKTKAARHYCVHRPEAIYIQYLDGFSLVDVAREIAFELGGLRPRGFRACLDVIEQSTSELRKIAVIDEADKMPKKYFEMLRGINERCNMPIVLVGEENLKRILETERRLNSRTRRVVTFGAIGVEDVYMYYEKSLGLTIDLEIAKKLHKRSAGDFRFVVRDAINVARIMNLNSMQELTDDVLEALEK